METRLIRKQTINPTEKVDHESTLQDGKAKVIKNHQICTESKLTTHQKAQKTPIDKFYPNAVHCLLALYSEKFKHVQNLTHEHLKTINIWREIEDEMQESYFDFNQEEIRAKFQLLREQYFNLRTINDIKKFEYFHQLHRIYQDEAIEAVVSGGLYKNRLKYYGDEIFLKDLSNNYHEEISTEVLEIVENAHKMEVSNTTVDQQLNKSKDDLHIETLDSPLTQQKETENNTLADKCVEPTSKRVKIDVSKQRNGYATSQYIENASHEKPNHKQYHIVHHENLPHLIPSEIDFGQFYEQQERRHQEKMEIWRKSLDIQERAIEIQQKLLQQLINRTSTKTN